MAIERALVLSGGSIKGAFQAGAIGHVLTKFEPDVIVGTSVGSLNGGFLADRASLVSTTPRVNWAELGGQLVRFWKENITGLGCIAKKRGLLGVALSLSKRFDGLFDTAPLRSLVRQQIKAESLRRSPVKFLACAVNIASGKPVYADGTYPDIVEHIIASTAIPLLMPITMIGSEPFWDGGIREVAPLKKAIELGAKQIVCIACDPKNTGAVSIPAGKAPFSVLSSRLMDMVVNEILNNDIDACLHVNAYLNEFGARGSLAGKRRIDLIVIRPSATLNIDLETFTTAQITEMLETGKKTAEQEL